MPFITRESDHPAKILLRQIRMPQVHLAQAIGVSLSSLNQWLSGYRSPPPEVEKCLQEVVASFSDLIISGEPNG